MKTWINRAAWVAVPLRWYLGLLFIGASWHKIISPESFAVDVATYDILPLALINIVALVLPWVELSAGLLLIVGWQIRAASWLISAMMFVFVLAVIIALIRGLDMSCGCFASQTAAEDPISALTVVRDSVWLVMAVFILVFDRGLLGLDYLIVRRPTCVS